MSSNLASNSLLQSSMLERCMLLNKQGCFLTSSLTPITTLVRNPLANWRFRIDFLKTRKWRMMTLMNLTLSLPKCSPTLWITWTFTIRLHGEATRSQEATTTFTSLWEIVLTFFIIISGSNQCQICRISQSPNFQMQSWGILILAQSWEILVLAQVATVATTMIWVESAANGIHMEQRRESHEVTHQCLAWQVLIPKTGFRWWKKGEQTDKVINLASKKYELEKQKHSVTIKSLEIDKDTKLLDRESKLTSLLFLLVVLLLLGSPLVSIQSCSRNKSNSQI